MNYQQIKYLARKRNKEAKRKLDDNETNRLKKKRSRTTKKHKDDQEEIINKLKKELPTPLTSFQKQQAFVEFECRTSQIKHVHCKCCHKTGINLKVSTAGTCTDCAKYKDNNFLLEQQALPIWYDDSGTPQFTVPPELKILTMAEKMLIQLNSPFIPLQHIKNGTFGLSGHVCSFEQDVEEFINKLPRHKDDVTMLKVLKVVRIEMGANDKRNDSAVIESFRVNKAHVGAALRWLKQYNVEYKHILIDMSALDWLEGNTGTMDVLDVEVPDVTTREDKRDFDKEDLGPNPAFTRTLEIEGSHVKTFGYMDDSAAAIVSPEDRQIHNEVLGEIDNHVQESNKKVQISVRWPNCGPIPINEFTCSRLFARAYPWLFPGGIGDVKDFPGGFSKIWGRNLLYYEDGRFTKDKFFCFFALNYITRQRNASSGNWFINDFNKGGPQTLQELKDSIRSGDNSFVSRINYFNRCIKGSSPFWFSKRQELYTWINHHVEKGNGAPNYFITLSCCEHYWADIIQLLRERLIMAGDDPSICYVGSPKLSQILNDFAIVVQEYFQKRVQLWLDIVGKKVLDIAHYWIRFEFAPGRGQIHAHLLAIVGNKTILKLLHQQKKLSKEKRDEFLAAWASNTMGLTASFDPQHQHKDIIPQDSPCTIRFMDVANTTEARNHDIQQLMQFCQQHQCSQGFCLKPDPHKRSRMVCKSGAGSPLTPGQTDTPGFPLRINPEVIREDGKHLKLHMPRNHSRLNQTAKDVLQSWRGNCDVQILIYESDPDCPNVKEISRVTDYVVSYNTKGNSTWMEEITTSKNLILNANPVTDDKMDLKNVCKKIMNKAATRRLISKQEASVLLADLPLTKCSEFIETVSISPSKKLSVHISSSSSSSKFLSVYGIREPRYHHLSLHQYYSIYREQIQHKEPAIPHYVGVNGFPCFPPSQGYARHVLICYRPWIEYPNQKDWLTIFNGFINSRHCPLSARLTYDRVMQRHFEGTKFVDLKSHAVDHSGNPVSEEDQAALLLSNMGVKDYKDFNMDIIDLIDKGENFNWDKPPMPRNITPGEETIQPEKWLWEKIKQQRELEGNMLNIPKRDDGSDFEIIDLYPDQQFIAYKVLEKIQEFMTCKDHTNFKPLHCTVVGQGGTGKSVLFRTITSVVRRLFCNTNVVRIAAPTGVAAFNVGGETLHRMTCRGIGGGYEANSLSPSEMDTLVKRFCDLLVVIIDERSMVPSSLFGTTSQILNETIYEGGMQQCLESFGGVPCVVVGGDDYQLPTTAQGAIECLTRSDGTKMTEKGRQCFRECGQTVFELSTSRRVSDKRKKDKEIMEAVREGEHITDAHIAKLQSLHLDKIKDKHGPEVVEEIKSKAAYLFWTNDKRIQHNLNMLVKLNSPSNPTAILKTKSIGSKNPKGVNSHFRGSFPGTAMMCRFCKVAIQGCNFQPLWGLHNGACGEVQEMIFAQGTSPNNNDLPSYIVCNFPLYCGPIWDRDNPKHVPIPIMTVDCKYHCCKRTYMPLDLAFARTIHKFQGLSAGPVDEGKIPNMYEHIICDPDVKASEVRALGLFYTALSRATTLGDDDGLNSAIYFTGSNITKERIQRVTMQSHKNQEYINVTRRRHWVQYLKDHTIDPTRLSKKQLSDMIKWTKKTISHRRLHKTIRTYIKHRNN